MDPIWLSIAFILGFIVRLTGLPPLVGYLMAGFILKGMGVEPGDIIHQVSDLGVTLLLFTIGLKLKIKDLAKPEIAGSATLHMAVTTGIAGGFLLLFSMTGWGPFAELDIQRSLIIAFGLSFSSTVFAVKVLEEKGETGSIHGRVAIGILVVQDIVAVVFLVLAAGKIPSVYALAVLPALFLLRPLLFRIMDRTGHGEMLILFGFFLALVPGAELFKLVGLKPDLGALVAGMIMASHPKAKELSQALMGFKDIFLIGFFLSIGLSGIPTPGIIVVAFILALGINIKVFLYFVILTRFKLRARTALNATLPLANFSEFGLIVVSITVAQGLLPQSWLVTMALALSISFVVSSPMNTFSHTIYDMLEKWLHIFETRKRLPHDQPLDIGDAEILIFGMGHLGTAAYDHLNRQYGKKVLGLDYDQERITKLKESGRNVLHDDATDNDFWEKIREKHLDHVNVVLLCLNDHRSNLYALERLKAISYQGLIAATAQFDDQIQELKEAGVDSAYNLFTEAGAGFADQLCLDLNACELELD